MLVIVSSVIRPGINSTIIPASAATWGFLVQSLEELRTSAKLRACLPPFLILATRTAFTTRLDIFSARSVFIGVASG